MYLFCNCIQICSWICILPIKITSCSCQFTDYTYTHTAGNWTTKFLWWHWCWLQKTLQCGCMCCAVLWSLELLEPLKNYFVNWLKWFTVVSCSFCKQSLNILVAFCFKSLGNLQSEFLINSAPKPPSFWSL